MQSLFWPLYVLYSWWAFVLKVSCKVTLNWAGGFPACVSSAMCHFMCHVIDSCENSRTLYSHPLYFSKVN